MLWPSFSIVFISSAFVRLIFLLYGEYQDANFNLKYTDIDYKVFTDASSFVLKGSSPYHRSIYRYTPLLSFLLVPNITIHKAFGKCLFILSDVLLGWLNYKILTTRGIGQHRALKYSLIWLANPFVMNISSRGNAESVIGLLVLLCFYLILKRKLVLGSVMFGLAVHFKVYPVIYSIPLLVFLDEDYTGVKHPVLVSSWMKRAMIWLNRERILFAVISASACMALNVIMYSLYGHQFLQQSYLYHITRQDHRHNFSPYFYHLYLSYNSPHGSISGLLSFIPQLLLVVVVGVAFGKDVFFSAFLQTFIFVTFNKVCTSQYFMWYLSLFPAIAPFLHIKFWEKSFYLLLLWISTQGIWLYYAYQLEFMNNNTFLELWVTSLLFFLANVWIVCEFIWNYDFRNVFKHGKVADMSL